MTGGSNKRVSLAALIATRPGHPVRLIYRTRAGRGRDQRKGFTETDYARFLDAAHQTETDSSTSWRTGSHATYKNVTTPLRQLAPIVRWEETFCYRDLAADHTFDRTAELPWQTTCLGKQAVLPELRFLRLADIQIPSPLCDHTQSCNFATLGLRTRGGRPGSGR